jgi:cytochrome c peroxidase
MKRIRFNMAASAMAALLCALVVAGSIESRAQAPEGRFGVGIPEVFVRKYLAFRAAQLAGGAPVLRVRLGYVKGLSRSFTSLAGDASFDLESGAFRIDLASLTRQAGYGVWLMDNAESDGVPATAFRLAALTAPGPTATVTGTVDAAALPAGFTIDRIVVADGIDAPASPLASGSVNVFQKILLRRLSLVNESAGAVVFQETARTPRLASLVPDLAAQTGASPTATGGLALDTLISSGAKLFFQETFRGNGRTCGTCHPANNNFTIDPAFIKTLPRRDPLFVAEFNPELAQLERPKLMRAFGLILENLDGLDDPANKFVMRGVPHTLGLAASLERDTSLPNAPAQMTGWSGDGAPGAGSLRDFAIGAVTQHFTKRLARVPGRDFRLPTEAQLDAMEAFQLSLGRSTDFDLGKVVFRDQNVETGKALFANGTGDPAAGGSCGFCHQNGGALSLNGQNRNFNTNVEDAVHPARAIEHFARDGGFGQTASGDGSFGDQSFNIASVVEAADTPPFFHNNIVDTLEGVVEFYSSPLFNDSRAPSARLSFNPAQTRQIANFMRALNILSEVEVCRRELVEILANRSDPRQEQDTRLLTALDGTEDAIGVLKQGGIFPAAVTHLNAARTLVTQAQRATTGIQRRLFIGEAIVKLTQARNAVATVAP